jgi:hypothetical protein
MTSSTEIATTGAAPSSEVEKFMSEFASDSAPVGLEDIGADDIRMAKVSIVHDEGVFVDDLTGEKFDTLDTVLLGVIKERVLFDSNMDAKDKLLCKSRDAVVGNPTEAFPMLSFREKNGVVEADGTITCKTCPFAQWGSHPDPNRQVPYCTEQMSFPLTLPGSDDAAGIVTFQRSALSNVRSYLSAFVRSRKPLFANRTTITLEKGKKGSVVFSTPKFVRGAENTDAGQMQRWAEQYQSIRAGRGQRDDETPAPAAVAAAASEWTSGGPVDADAPF